MDAFTAVMRETLFVTAILALPVLLSATAAGTLVALVQAVTQVQEQTLTLLPKLCVVVALVVAFGAFGMSELAGLFEHGIAAIGAIVGTPI